jgi:peptide/nickel transport system ATP-binding protein
MSKLLQIEDLTVTYRSRNGALHRAIEGVSFALEPGQALGILGESGSGKTTIALSILRLLPAEIADTRGAIFFGGKNVLTLEERAMHKRRGAEISMIFQEPAVAFNPVRRVGDQIAEIVRVHRHWNWKRCRAAAEEMLAAVGLHQVARIYRGFPHQLSGGQLQRVAIAQALVCRPNMVIADEPTVSLDAVSRAGILQLLRDLKEQMGIAFLVISHQPAVLAALADRILVIHEGRVVEAGASEQILSRPRHLYTQTLLECGQIPSQEIRTDKYGSTAARTLVRQSGSRTSALISLHDLKKCYSQRRGLLERPARIPALRGINLEIHRGATLALLGESGSGKSTLGKCLAGLESFDSGEIRAEGRSIAGLSRKDRLAFFRHVQLVFQDSASALNPNLSASEIISEPLLIQRVATARERHDRALALMEQVGLSAAWASRRPLEFSGGQRQRLAIARALVVQPKLLIFDESFSGLDLLTQKQIVRLLQELQSLHGLTYLYITHDLSLAARWADSFAMMSRGEIVEQGSTMELFSKPDPVLAPALFAGVSAVEAGTTVGR